MIIYGILLLITAAVAYVFGSLSTLVLASNFLFRYNLNRFGRGNDWLSNFRRVYGLKGALELLLVEAVKDVIPIVIGGLLLGIKGHADVGRAFAGFCLIMGRLWPAFYGLRGTSGIMPLIFTCIFADASLGIAVSVVFIGALAVIRYMPLAAGIAALAAAVAPLLIVENKVVIYLLAFSGVAVLVKHIKGIAGVVKGTEQKLAFREDLSYKFETKF
ncbi:MAG: glycerol-3-phosphate acyltransferase [Eubacteriales bacterium]|nr:glycerol-3-phosphate acyltransferase [Eubacteriales bacterium]